MKILSPVDQSPRDGVVLPYCVRMAKALDATVAVAHVVSVTRGFFPNAMREAEAYVTAVEAGLHEQDVATEGIVCRGDPAIMITRLVDELRVDMIVMATRGRRGLDKLIVGSVAEAVLANCQKPVLLVSETANGTPLDENVRLQSAYLATVIWHKAASGLYTREEAERELDRLAAAGLDRGVLRSTYQAEENQGVPFAWLDIDFQVRTLRQFLPEDVHAVDKEALPQFPGKRAA